MIAPLSPSAFERIDKACDRFEAAWKAGQEPRVEDYLNAAAGPERDALQRELLQVDAHYRGRVHAAPTVVGRFVAPPRDVPSVAGYEVLGELGRGGMGVVYKARQLRPNRLVALKMISAGVHAGPRELERFLREADAVAHLQHPNIVQVYEAGEQNGHPYFALEYVAGGSLDQYLAGTPQPPDAAAQLVERLAHAIHHAHERGIIHRDLKPANVLLQKDRETGRHGDTETEDYVSLSPCLPVSLSSAIPKITDFGLAKLLDAAPGSPTRTGDVLGTPSYMAPEQVGGAGQISAATDVYGLGAILYELLTGRPPFRAETALETMLQVQTIEPVSPSRLQPQCPRDLVTICLKCLSKQPHQRYVSALELADDLRRFLDHQPIRARPVGPLQHVLKWTRRQPKVASLAGLLLLAVALGVGTGIWFWWQAEQGLQKAEDALGKEHAAEADRVATLDRYRVALAHREWLANNVGRAAALLDDCTPQHQQSWEWRYLDRLRHSSLRTFADHTNTVQAVAFHPSGRKIASASHDDSVRLWDLDTGDGTILGRHPRSAVMAVAYSPDGRLLASSDMHFGRIKLWDMETREERELFFGGEGEVQVRGLAFDPESRFLAAGGPGRLKVWDTHNQEWVYEVAGERQIFQVAFSSDGRYLATSSSKVKVWDWKAKAHKPAHDWPDQPIEARDLAFNPKGNLLAFGARDGLVRVYSLETGKEAFTLHAHQLPVTSVSFNHDGQRLATAGMDGDMHIWNVKQRRRLFTLHGHSGAVFDLAYSPNGSRLVSCGLDRLIRVWDAAQGREVVTTRLRLPGGEGTLLYSRDSRLLAWVTPAGQAGVWDVVNQREVYRLRAAGARPGKRALAGSPDGRYFAWGCSDGTVRLWDTEGRQEVPLPQKGTHSVAGLAFTPDGRLIVTRRRDRAMLLSDAHTGRELHELPPPSDRSYFAAFCCDGRNLTLVSGAAVQEWDTDSGRLVRTLPPQPESIVIAAYSPVGDAIAFGGVHGRVWVWDRVAGRERVVCAGHPRRVHGLSFSADGRRLASSGSDCTAKLWDTQTGDEVLALRTQLHERSPLAFSPDGADLAAVTIDNQLQIWSTRRDARPLP